MVEKKDSGLPPIRSSMPVGGGGGPRPSAPVVSKSPAPEPRPSSQGPVQHPPETPASAPRQETKKTPPVGAASATRPPAAPRKARQDKPRENDPGIWRLNRKSFLNVAGWFAFFSFLATATIGALRLMVPRVLYEAPSAFKAGYPDDFIVGEVDETYKDEYRVWIVRELDGFYALSAICTHLGCTPRWLASERKFKCPCHGSGFHMDGTNFEGPAPRPLERLKITLADDGKLVIDRKVKFLYEKQEWGKPGSYLSYT